MASRFVPKDWILTDKLRAWTREKGMTNEMIDEEIVHFRLYEWVKPKTDFNRCWQTRILLGLKKGWIEIPKERQYRQPEIVTEDMRRLDAQKSVAQMDKWRKR